MMKHSSRPPSSDAPPADLPFSALWPYLAIAFALAWGILGLYIAFWEGMSALFGPLSGNHPLFFLAVAVLVVCWNRKSMLEGTDAVTAVIPLGR